MSLLLPDPTLGCALCAAGLAAAAYLGKRVHQQSLPLFFLLNSIPDPDPHVFGPRGSGSISQRCGSGSFYHEAKTLIPTVM
jgi:hypothetical protein